MTGSGPTDRPAVEVAVLTYRRPEDLAELLPLLVEHVADVDADVEILVVDNDPDGGAADDVAALDLPGVRYVHEPTPGIAAARNRAIDESASADVMVFIDDDERPKDGWLSRLVQTYLVDRPAAVVGPVISTYAVEPDPWLIDGRFFVRRRMPTGTVVEVAATNNLLLDVAVLGRLGLRFDERFGLTGGSDTLFSRQLTAAGHRIVWCDEAIVLDVVPVSRLTRRWVLRKAFRSGNSWSRTSLDVTTGRAARLKVRAVLVGRGGVRALGGAAMAAAGTVARHRGWQARGARTCARGLGMLTGAGGHVFAEYRRPA